MSLSLPGHRSPGPRGTLTIYVGFLSHGPRTLTPLFPPPLCQDSLSTPAGPPELSTSSSSHALRCYRCHECTLVSVTSFLCRRSRDRPLFQDTWSVNPLSEFTTCLETGLCPQDPRPKRSMSTALRPVRTLYPQGRPSVTRTSSRPFTVSRTSLVCPGAPGDCPETEHRTLTDGNSSRDVLD